MTCYSSADKYEYCTMSVHVLTPMELYSHTVGLLVSPWSSVLSRHASAPETVPQH